MPDLDRLDAREVRLTVDRLEERIAARFPGRGIVRLAARLAGLVDEVESVAPGINTRLRRARVVSRVAAGLVLVATLVAVALALRDTLDDGVRSSIDWLPLIETTINDLVYAAIALYFLYSIPERFRTDFVPTPRSVDPQLGPQEMERYLEYCSEMLSLIGKTAALVAEESRDAVVLDAVGGIETLTTSLSRKLWQKIALLSRL